ncbi:hybrid sensor histidine kinase/response regulator [Sporolactobacillus laevolacticus]|uniref:histidine kinase n=1 Tax=Sporolactobacillus laevolacticus DSM 442 TaxID=1395513 RepID=V6IYL4_9BACL|nr:ATP-binding protein [Sporolactobacillus laevolacticus]EST11831.1 histidine kinase [Sporolactobacillus laevolacticus DSM 442]
MHRLFAMIIVLLTYTGLFLIFLSWNHFSEYNGPVAKHGVLDLSHWNFEKNGDIQLNGQWRFYPDQLLTTETVKAGNGKNERFITVPENTRSSNSMKPYYTNAGTYRLLIRSDRDQMFGLQAASVYSSSKIYMNGTPVGGSGKPSLGSDQRASLKPAVSYFPIHRGSNELLIQVSRTEGVTGWAITKPIAFGTQQQISRNRDLSVFNDMVMVAAFFFMGLYFFGYFIQRRKDFHLLFFSIICLLLSMIISLLSPGRVIYILFPDLPFRLLVILEATGTLFISVAFLLYLFFAYPELVSRKVTVAGVVLSFVTLIMDFMPWDFLTPIELFLHSFLAVSILAYASYIFVLAIIRKAEGSIYLMIATLSMSIFVIITIIRVYSSKTLTSLYSISSLLFLLMLSLLMSQRFANAFKRSESLAQELVRSDQLKDEFIARTSHEFRTPLNGIINITQTLLAGKKERTIGDEKDKLHLITRIGYRLSALVNDILDLEKMKQGTLQVNPVPLDIYSTVQTELAFYQLLAEKKGLTIVNNLPNDLPLVFADENRFRQIVNNLVDNAVKYTPTGKIALSAKQLDHAIEIMVADTGTGIPASEHESVFQAFERRDKLNQSEGAGLGLSIVKQLVELQKGKIWVHSEVGLGSVFHFTVPLFNQKQAVATGASVRVSKAVPDQLPSEQLPGGSLHTPYYSPAVHAPTILVVDDDLENLKILIDMLEGIPYNVIAVKNGKEALNEVVHSKPDLVVLDLMMPGMSGFDVCSRIREQYSLTELPVLMLTAAIINEDKHYAFRSGANDILQKPYNFSEFSARVRGLILMKNAASQATNMEVAFLQSQIRPHFLYNVLNSIIALSYDDIEKAREMTAQFAAYLRGSFDFQNTSAMSTFKKELSLVKSYLTIEKMRFQDRVQVKIDVEEQLDFPLPPLMIQPLVENAVQHGIGKRKAGGRVILSVNRRPNGYAITVEDNGVGMDENKVKNLLSNTKSGSVGIKNINERLKHYFGTQLVIQSATGQGTIVSYTITVEASHEPSGSRMYRSDV